ncbi:pseudouridine synthase [Pararhodonellum marinum]|uniref:pseudouridine synthase n=1 Tax=Pararhodonellum marinum TaxID=2755358 RepID=UPI00188E419E|nr:pseudouridine synthase [Pararhodonellum marinum]
MKNKKDDNQKSWKKDYGSEKKPGFKSNKYSGKKDASERPHDPGFSPLKKFKRADEEPCQSKPIPEASKSVYKGRGKDQKPVYAPLDPKDSKQGTKKPFKSGFKKPTGKGIRGEQLERPEYNFKKIEKQAEKTPVADEIRLNKYIANSGICSRREADKLIEKGEIKVNGEVITSLGHKVLRKDRVTYKGSAINPEKPVYLLMNKPKDFITTTDDPLERKTVMDLIKNACEERVFPVGRLDRNTTGLLLFTNDGELAAKLSHPSNKIKKIYQVTLDKPLNKNDEIKILEEGLTLEDGPVKVDDMQVLSKDRTILGLEIHVGKNRIVRRIFAHLGYDVVALDRVVYAGLTKKDIKRGSFRFLSEMEVVNLKYFK